jgi:hypothetical protein
MDFVDDHVWAMLLFLLGLSVSALFVISVISRQIDYHYEARTCPKYAIQYNRQTKFATYNYWQYECLVKTDKNSWVPITNLYNNVQQ